MMTNGGTFTVARTITPSDTLPLPIATYGIWVGGAGNLSVVTSDNQTIAITAVPAGTLLPFAVNRVRATGTTATNLVALG